jgi:hypothetical protein
VGLGYLSLFAASSRLGDSSDLSAASGFDTLGCGGAGCVFGLAESASHR